MAEALFLDVDRQVARRLLDCLAPSGIAAAEPWPLTQEGLVAMPGLSRPTANRVLLHLEDQGTVQWGRRHIVIVSLPALAGGAG